MNKLAWQFFNTLMIPCFLFSGYYMGTPNVNWALVALLFVFGGLLNIAVIAFVCLDTWDAMKT